MSKNTDVDTLIKRNIIIIANNKENIPDLRKFPLPIGPNDLIVRFNVGLYPADDNTFESPLNLISMFREKAVGVSGIRNDGKIDCKRLRYAKEYYLIGGKQDTAMIEKIEKRNNIKLGVLRTDLIKKEYQLEKTPSSGFIAMIHFMVNYPNARIILFGFSWQGWSGHNFDKERSVARDLEAKGRLLIIPSVKAS